VQTYAPTFTLYEPPQVAPEPKIGPALPGAGWRYEQTRRARLDQVEALRAQRRLEQAAELGRDAIPKPSGLIDLSTDLRAALAERGTKEQTYEQRRAEFIDIDPGLLAARRGPEGPANGLRRLSECRLAGAARPTEGLDGPDSTRLLPGDARPDRRRSDGVHDARLKALLDGIERNMEQPAQLSPARLKQFETGLADMLKSPELDSSMRLRAEHLKQATENERKRRQAALDAQLQADVQARRAAFKHPQPHQPPPAPLRIAEQVHELSMRGRAIADALMAGAALIGAEPDGELARAERAWTHERAGRLIPKSMELTPEAKRLRERERALFTVKTALEEGLIQPDEARMLGLEASEVEKVREAKPGPMAEAASHVTDWFKRQLNQSLAHAQQADSKVTEMRQAIAEAFAAASVAAADPRTRRFDSSIIVAAIAQVSTSQSLRPAVTATASPAQGKGQDAGAQQKPDAAASRPAAPRPAPPKPKP
ncbi:hypothetical protein, partial [Paraburkholderia guartelaensis]|uniref:hypothetical protein n=1 Tax=Paraburkholderia guartelaensis TaxID=2546446 RepID=UPI00140BB6A1